MKRYLNLVGIFLILGMSRGACADALRTEEQKQAALGWAFQGVDLGSTELVLRTKWPDMKPDQDSIKKHPKYKIYRSFKPISGADAMEGWFENGRLVILRIYYATATLNKWGGIDAVATRLHQMFGPADYDSPGSKTTPPLLGELWWTFEGVPRKFTLRQMATISMLEARNTEVDTTPVQDLGF